METTMCGLIGFWNSTPQSTTDYQRQIKKMSNTIVHRGPDDEGAWYDPKVGIALGFRRLSILDLSPTGHQPMFSADGRYVITFNGEIYNYQDVRAQLEKLGHNFRGHSDTEVILSAVLEWGTPYAIERLSGMFAIALYDITKRELLLARDRLGEKPLYYGWQNSTFLFGSELKALRAHSAWEGEIDRSALAMYLKYNYVPAPYSIHRRIFKLPPGTFARITWEQIQARSYPQPVQYWSASTVAQQGLADPFRGSTEEAVLQLDSLLKDAVRRQMVADVPLGAFLSGGVDSSTIVALMQSQSSRPVKTFTIGFEVAEYDEAHHARAVAEYLGTEHTELYVTSAEALAVIPKLPTIYDEPFADSSQIPTYLVSALARQHVTVSLSGDGGDELFGGYNRYFMGATLWRQIRWVPLPLRDLASRGLVMISPHLWTELTRPATRFWPTLSNAGDKIHKAAAILNAKTPLQMYDTLVSHWKKPWQVINGMAEHTGDEAYTSVNLAGASGFLHKMMFEDLVTYLPDDILVKVDRAAMSVSLESRVPMLDPQVVEFAWTLPLHMKIRDGKGKWVLRQVLYQYVPRSIIERPKMGFGVPLDRWLRKSLRTWAEELLDERAMREQNFFNPTPIRTKWEEHRSGTRNWAHLLWNILMFQAWLQELNR